MFALFRNHPAVASRRRRPCRCCPATKRLFCPPGKRAKTHPCDGNRNLYFDRLAGKSTPECDTRFTLFTISFQRIPGHAGPQKYEIVKVRERSFGAPAADL